MKGSRRPLQFSLTTILLVTGLVACCLAVMRLTPFWGTAALLITALSLLRNALVVRAAYPEDVATIGRKLELFLESVSVVLLCVVAAGVGLALAGSVTIVMGMLLSVNGVGDLFRIVAGAAGVIFCVAATIGAFVYTFWKLTFPVRSVSEG